jgi:queuine/archaeosine tRNA-ribosyltransferase
MEFVASMTHRADELRKIFSLWKIHGDDRNPFARTIFTPLFARPNVVKLMDEFFRSSGGVMFDSGGYYVQQGVVTYDMLYQKLMVFYQQNDWADWYILPDYVPTSSLSVAEVDSRVNATVTVSKLFFTEMPPSLRQRALPVVQGHTREQIQHCVENYAEMGLTYIGFGSFGTSGSNNSINTITRQSIQMIEFLKQRAQKYRLKIHLFGIGTPNILPIFSELGIDSFDSSCWSRTAGYGNVYLPFIGRRNITQRMLREIGGEAYNQAKFAELKDATGHNCPFCEDIDTLKHSRIYQMMHNLVVMLDTVDALNAGKIFIPELVGVKESRYKTYRQSQ